jgi:hypothetical protein
VDRPGLVVESCYWGDTYGATLAAGGASIPAYLSDAPGYTFIDPDEELVGFWDALQDDPLAQLRLMAEFEQPALGEEVLPPGFRTAGSDVLARLVELRPAAELGALLADTGLAGHLEPALLQLRAAPELAGAARAHTAAPDDLAEEGRWS